MLSFKITDAENIKETVNGFDIPEYDEEARNVTEEIIESFVFSDIEDIEYAFNVNFGCLLVRICDMGRYVFPFPFEICEDANVDFAVLAIAEYAMREEIPLVFSDVPPEGLSCFAGFRHMKLDAESGEELSYRVRIETECELLSEIPELGHGDILLTEILDCDCEDFAALSRDEETLKYWGYDYRDDVGENVDDGYFLNKAREEFDRGVSLSLAVRYRGEFVGEAVFYAFNGRGNAEVAIRILPKYRGVGIGSSALGAVIELAGAIGLSGISTKVFKENIPSIKMVSKQMKQESEDFNTATYTRLTN